MKAEKYLKVATGLTLAGVLFSGYLAGTKLLSGTCAFNESCPVFLGYPACYYGFVMFATMFVATVYALAKKVTANWPMKLNIVVSLLGILFAGNFVVREVASWFVMGFQSYGLLGLSTCAYGLVFYIIVFVLSLYALLKKDKPVAAAAPAPTPAPKA